MTLEPPRLDFSEIFTSFWNASPSNPSKNPKNAKDAKNAKKVLRMLTIFEVQTHAFDHEGLFYHIGRGKKRWAAVLPPGGLQ